MGYSGGSTKPEAYLPVFPRPLITASFPPNQCLCTWVWSPTIYGTIRKPHVLKVMYLLCPVHGPGMWKERVRAREGGR